ncbi:MAG: MFS transporter [Armatimonadetes bacterium]|nr:MFS transporter [Armatimonadota bacterium]
MSAGLSATLRGLRGNARGAVLTEPLWGIPFHLFAPYASIYMVALGMSDGQVGLVTSVALAGQIVFALLSGVIADKMGRRRATLVFDIIAWSIPCLIWAAAQNMMWFVVGGLVNSVRRVPDNTWNLLLVEDTDPDELVHIYALAYMAGQLAVFFAPLAGLLISRYTLIPTVRGLYVLAAVMMTTKFLVMNAMVTETRQGRVRMAETAGRSVFALLGEVGGVVRQILAARHTVLTIALMAIVSIVGVVQSTFWSIIVTERIGIPARHIAYYPFARSLVMLACLFLVVPRLRGVRFGKPMAAALGAYALSALLLVAVPEKGYALLLVSTVLESAAYSVVATQIECLAVWNVDARERARIVSIAHVAVIACTTPFGWIAGLLSEADRALPFLLNAALLVAGILIVGRLRAVTDK